MAAVSAEVWRCVRSAAFDSLLAVEIVLTALGVASWAPFRVRVAPKLER
jgi:hypothetical protein